MTGTTKDYCNELRAEILTTVKKVDAFRKDNGLMTGSVPASDKGEIIANITLSLRHLEDARMRLGKAIQAYEGRESIYPG